MPKVCVLALVTAATVATLAVAELVLRQQRLVWANPFLPNMTMRAGFADGVGYYDYHTNEESYRSRDFADVPAGGSRLLVLGDSNAWGSGVNDADRLGDLVGLAFEREGLPTAVWTLAWPAATFREYRAQYERGRALAPDFVLIVSTLGNDFVEGLEAPAFPRSYRPVREWAGLREPFRQLHLYHLGAAAGASMRRMAAGTPERSPAYYQAAKQATLLRDEWARSESVRSAAEHVLALAAELEGDGRKALLVAIPSRVRAGCAGPDLAAEVPELRGDRTWAVELEGSLLDDLRAAIAPRLPVVDANDALHGACASSYFPIDWHLSPEGHRRVAEWLLASAPELDVKRRLTFAERRLG